MVLALLLACRSAVTERPDVVVVVLDTVRADHLSGWGYGRPTTPNLDRFAAGAVRYPHAHSSAPWTLPAHGSMFTGRLPSEHGAHLQPDGTPRAYDGRFVTLAEVLVAEGYRTDAIVANQGYLTETWGLFRGFGSHEVVGERADGITRRALRRLEAGDGPRFLFVNYMDAHRPFHTEAPRPEVVGHAVSTSMEALDTLKAIVLPGERDAPDALVRAVTDQYDTALANLDAGLGPLLDHLRDRPNTVVVVTSDHGEFLGEHRWGEHPRDVYEAAVAVPLVVAAPGLGAGVSDDVVLSHDVPRLILRAAGLDGLVDRFPARPPVSELRYDHEHYLSRPELRERLARVRRAWFDWPYKLIETAPGGVELYDLASDPEEHRDLAAIEPERVARLLAELHSLPAAADGGSTPALSPDERERFEALGYLQ